MKLDTMNARKIAQEAAAMRCPSIGCLPVTLLVKEHEEGWVFEVRGNGIAVRSAVTAEGEAFVRHFVGYGIVDEGDGEGTEVGEFQWEKVC